MSSFNESPRAQFPATTGPLGVRLLILEVLSVLRRHGFSLLILSMLAALPNAIRVWKIEQIGGPALLANPNLGHTPELMALACLSGVTSILFMIISTKLVIRSTLGVLAGGRKQILRSLAVFVFLVIAVWLGSIFLIVPGIYLYYRWFLAFPLALTEDVGVFEAFRRSSKLIYGYKWSIALTSVVVMLPAIFVGTIEIVDFVTQGKPVPAISMYLVGTVTGLFLTCLPAVAYARLRIAQPHQHSV